MTESLRIIPLGGLGEVGKNMTIYEYGRNIMIVDAGMMIPEHDMFGIDLVIPDFSYLQDKADLVRGIVITHGHEDHIGGLPYLLDKVVPADTPIIGTRLACALIEGRLAEHQLLDRAVIRAHDPGDRVRVGPFDVEMLAITHSIPDGVGLSIDTEIGRIIHTGDFKTDYTPVHGGGPNLSRLGQLGAEGVLALLSDSTGAERAGFTPSEQVMDPEFDRIFREAPGRIIVATFASLLSRVQQVINAAQRHGRVAALAGYSMFKTVEIGRELGHLDIPDGVLVDLYETRRMPDDQVVIITTGSQGQPEAALARMAEGSHRQIDIKPGDTVVVSSNPIPGNEEEVSRVINKLFARGANVIYPPLAAVHVSGHASQEELKLMLALTRPLFFAPVHGELRHLYAHARLGRQLGIADDHIFIMQNGSVLELTRDTAEIVEQLPNTNVFVDGTGVGDIGPAVMRERENLARDGFVIAVVPVSASGEVAGKPELVSRGFVYLRESQELMEKAAERVWQVLRGPASRKSQNITDRTQEILRLFFYDETRRKPTIIAVVTRV
ncbi:MAG TPA: ribonuclease J [Anaerolineae bacterium]